MIDTMQDPRLAVHFDAADYIEGVRETLPDGVTLRDLTAQELDTLATATREAMARWQNTLARPLVEAKAAPMDPFYRTPLRPDHGVAVVDWSKTFSALRFLHQVADELPDGPDSAAYRLVVDISGPELGALTDLVNTTIHTWAMVHNIRVPVRNLTRVLR